MIVRRNTAADQHINGVLLLDKPDGMTSNQALQTVKRLFKACKVGHTGSLDPIATGLLPLCFGQATKIAQYLLGADKRYQAVIKLGEATDTYDSEGKIQFQSKVEVNGEDLHKVAEHFKGTYQQIPPPYSALKKIGAKTL